ELHLPWAWVCRDLIDYFAVRTLRSLHGKPANERIVYRFDPKVYIRCDKPIPERHLKKIMRKRKPRSGGVPLARYGRWLYESKLGGRKPYQLAKENHKRAKHPALFDECKCVSTVIEGIDEAQALLSLCPFFVSDL